MKHRRLRECRSVRDPASQTVPVRRAASVLREERERQGLTQAEAAERTGLSREVLCRLETQPGNATLKTLERYARGLGFEFQISLVPVKTKRKSRIAS